MDDIVADLKVMKIRQWIEKTKDKEQWRLAVEEAKAVAPKGRKEVCSETSVRRYQYSLRNNPELPSSHLRRSGSLVSRQCTRCPLLR